MMILMNVAEKSASIIKRSTIEDFTQSGGAVRPSPLRRDLAASRSPMISITQAGWPKYDESKLSESTVDVVFQVNGKVRDQCQGR
jgi:leucyl-tRNA synthetase